MNGGERLKRCAAVAARRIAGIAATLSVLSVLPVHSQEVNYGRNDQNGVYVDAGDARIYYEVYGAGEPVVLLHGGFAYIDQFRDYIPILRKKYKVIAVATRGYGKSEIGNQAYSYRLLAEDVKKVIDKECPDRAVIVGFSDGAMIAEVVACMYPKVVRKVVAMGGALGTSGYSQEGLDWLKKFNSEEFESYRPDFKSIMPQPERWDDFIGNLKRLWSTTDVLRPDDLRKIECPVLLLYGDHDSYCPMERVVRIYQSLPHAQLAVFPDSTHIEVSPRRSKNAKALDHYVFQFVESETDGVE